MAASANDTVRVACVGVRGQGRVHVSRYGAMPNVEVAAICDIDESVRNNCIADMEKAGKKRPAVYADIRKLLEDQSIDAVSIATPNHHHTLQTIWACQAGKDVYVEKPCSHDMFEARQIALAARKYNRLVQHGTNSRSSIARDAIRHLHDGLIGDVYMARGLCFKWRDTIGRQPAEAVPRVWTTICGLVPRPSMLSPRTASTTTGTGSGTTATAISGTRAFTRWMCAGGAWV
jgi:predicted dehydrogenase